MEYVGQDLLSYQGYIFDLDGTIYRGSRLLPGADRAVNTLRSRGKRVLFLSNKPIESREAYAAKLTRLGIEASVEDVVNSSLVTAACIAAQAPGATVYCIGEAPLLEELKAAGLVITEDPLRAQFLVVAFDRDFHYKKLHGAMLALRNGARYFATNPDRTCPVDGGEIPDCAGMMGAIEGVTGRRPETICGKPSPRMLQVALDRLGFTAADCLMVGDRLETDIQMGKDTGIRTALVLTGITTRESLEASAVKPDYVLENVGEILTGASYHHRCEQKA